MKKCPNCGEASDEQYDSCWKCGIGFDGTPVAQKPESPIPTLTELVQEATGTKFEEPTSTLSLASFTVAMVGLGLCFLAFASAKSGNGNIQLFPTNIGFALIACVICGPTSVIIGLAALLKSSLKIFALLGICIGLYLTVPWIL